MKSFLVSLLGLVLSVSVGAEPLLKGRVWLASGPPAAGVHVRLFDLTDLRRSVGTTTDEAGYFALPLATVGGPALPQDFALGQNYPNPFNPSTIIPYQIPTTTHVRLEVFNLLGQWLATLVDGERPAGAHTAHWDATDAAGQAVGAGVYIYRLTGDGHTVSRRMVLVDGQAGLPAGGSGPRQPAAGGVKTDDSVYGLTVAGAGLIAYVNPAFRVGSDPVNLVLEQPGGKARMKVATGGILGDVNNDSQVDAFDALYVALYSKDPSITLPNNGDISLGDVNGDGTVDLADALILALYTVNPSDPTLPPGIGQPVDGSGDDHGDSPSSATPLAVGGSRSGQIEPGGDVDYFRVQVSASGDLTVHTTGSLDTKGQLEDSAGSVLARDDDGGDGYNFRLAHAVSAGTYYIKVEGYNASTTGRYTIHASGPGGDGGPVNIPDANLRAVIAAELGKAPNAPITPDEMATLTDLEAHNQGIRDLTGLEFATNLRILVIGYNSISDVSPLASLTNLTYLYLHHNSITDVSPLAGLTNLSILELSNNSISDIAPLVANTGLGSGDEVYLVNNPLSSTSLNTHIPALESRGVIVQLEYLDDDEDDHGDSPSAATALAVGSSRSGQIEPGGDVDYFRVQVSSSGDLTVHTTGSLDTKGQLEDSAGAVLARDDDGGDGYNFRLAHAVSAGTYYIKVEGFNASTTGSYTIHASGPGGGDDGGPVNIPDANLRAVIADSLGKAPNAPITEGEMATLTSLEATDQGIRDLTGLEFATNLTGLNLGPELVDNSWVNSNAISNLSPLSGLTNLTTLWLDFNNIADLSPLSGLTNLTELRLDANNISDVSPLSGLTNLTTLDLSGNSLTDVSPLSGLTNLIWLNLISNNITDVSPLSGLTNLTTLWLDFNNIADLSPLSGLTNLTELGLDSNSLTDVSPLSGLTNLRGLWLATNSISDLAPLVANTGLGSGDEVYLSNNPLSSTSLNTHIPALESRGVTVHYEGGGGGDHGGPVNIPDANLRAVIAEALGKAPNAPITEGEMATLTSLVARDQGIRDLTGLEFATNLTGLNLGPELVDNSWVNSNAISNLSPLSGLTNLTWLYLSFTSLTDVSPLSGLTNLTTLDLGGNSLTDVSPLSGLTNLTTLDLGGNSLTDVSPLSGLTNLTGLWLYDNSLADVSPLSGLTNLAELGLSFTSLTDVSPLSGLTNLRVLLLSGNNLADVSPLSGLTNLTELWLNDNSISDISPLVANTGLGSGDEVYLWRNPLSSTSLNTHIPALESRGVTVDYEGSAKVITGDAKSSMQGRMNSPRSERINRKSAR